jgi:hypothetical protein
MEGETASRRGDEEAGRGWGGAEQGRAGHGRGMGRGEVHAGEGMEVQGRTMALGGNSVRGRPSGGDQATIRRLPGGREDAGQCDRHG